MLDTWVHRSRVVGFHRNSVYTRVYAHAIARLHACDLSYNSEDGFVTFYNVVSLVKPRTLVKDKRASRRELDSRGAIFSGELHFIFSLVFAFRFSPVSFARDRRRS